MHFAIMLITFLLALILSNVINRMIPKLPLPFIQLVFGLLLGLFYQGSEFKLDGELFLAFVIAPINFREGQESDITSFLEHRSIILYLILPTVFVTTLVLGYFSGIFLPIEMPLAACFALGAALGPTDAVAFISMANRFNFPKSVENILKSEGLLNDASGLVAFEFAVAALLTGTFSLAHASLQLLWSILGGFLIGFSLSLLSRWSLSLLEKFDAADVTGALLLELSLPLLAYFIASEVGVSGIIAVVIAGVMQARRLKKITLFDAQVDKVSHVVWDTVIFLLNGLVFMVFGFEMTHILEPALTSPLYSNWHLLGIVIAVTALLFLTRFLLLGLYYFWESRRLKNSFSSYVQDILLLTFSGVKGTVSIATILLLPETDSLQYSLTLFTVGAVTLLSFLTGLVVLPYLAGEGSEEVNHVSQISILADVVQILEEDVKNSTEKAALYAAIDNYKDRIERLILEQEPSEVKRELAIIQLLIIDIESDGLEYALSKGRIDLKEYRIYQRYLKVLEGQVNRGFVSNFAYGFRIFLRVLRAVLHEVTSFGYRIRQVLKKEDRQRFQLSQDNRDHLADVYLQNTELVLDALEELEGVYSPALVNFLQMSRLQEAEVMASGAFVERVLTRARPNNMDELLRGYYLERKLISEYQDKGILTAEEAKRLRKNVNELESYSLNEVDHNFLEPASV